MIDVHVVAAAAPATPTGSEPERIAARSRAARAARDLAAVRAGCPLHTFPQADDGRPLPLDGWHWSISHTRTWVAGTVHIESVGVDVERLHLRERLVPRVLTADELARFTEEPDPARRFVRAWTAKEAVVKASGRGLQDLSACEVLGVESSELLWIGYRGARCRVHQREHADHVLAVHAPGNGWRPVWHLP